MDPPTGSISATLSRRVKSTKNASEHLQIGQCWRGIHHHPTGLPQQVHCHLHLTLMPMTGLSYGPTLYQTDLRRQCRCQQVRGSQPSRWSHAWWIQLPRPPKRRRAELPTPPHLRTTIPPRSFSDPVSFLRHLQTSSCSRLNMTINIFHMLLNVLFCVLIWRCQTGDKKTFSEHSPIEGTKTFDKLSEIRHFRCSSDVSDSKKDVFQKRLTMYKMTIIIYNRSKRFLFNRRNVVSANCKCIIPKLPWLLYPHTV